MGRWQLRVGEIIWSSIFRVSGLRDRGNEFEMVRCVYNDDGELIAVTDRGRYAARRFTYERGLMAQHTLRGGLQCVYAW